MLSFRTRNALGQAILIGVLLSVTLVGGNISIVAFNTRLLLVGLAMAATVLIATLGSDLRTPLDGGWLLLGGATFAAVLFSGDARRSLEAWIFPLALQLPYFYGGVVLLRHRWPEQGWFRAFLLVGTVLFAGAGGFMLAAVARWQQVHPPLTMPFPPEFRLSNILDNPNVFGAWLTLLIPAIVGYTAVARAQIERRLCVIWLIAAALCLIATGSRNNQFAAAVGSLATLALIGLSSKERATAIRAWLSGPPIRKIGIGLAGVGGAVILIGVLVYESTSGERIAGAVSRLVYWQAALEAAAQHPIFGIGMGMYPVALMHAQSVPPLLIERHAHNALLNMLAEGGIVGLIALLTFGGLLIRTARLAWRAATPARRLLLGGLIGGLIGFGLSNLFDTPLIHSAPLFVATTFCALLAAPQPDTPTNQRAMRTQRIGLIATSFVICGIAAVLLGLYSIAWTGAQQDSAQTLDRGAALDPHDALVAAQAAVAWTRLADSSPTSSPASSSDAGALDQAIAHYRAAIQLDPANAVHHLNLAMLLKRKGDSAGALTELTIAIQEAPDSAVMQLNYGVALEAAGQVDAAQAAYQQALRLEERWRGALFWQSTPIRQQAQNAVPPGPRALFMAAVQAGDAARHANQPDAAHAAYLHAVSLALDESGRDLARGWAAVSQGDMDGARYFFSAVIAINSGDTPEALLALGEMDAARGDEPGMRAQFQAAYNWLDAYGAFGPGRLGDITYAVNVFGRFAYLSDYVPGVLLLDMTPATAADFVTLAQDEIAHGNPAHAAAIYRRILIANPGYAPAVKGLAGLPAAH